MTNPEPQARAQAPAPEVRVSTVVGDRLCIKCSFNLSGQPVVRENVYGMAMVRCPECSTVASLQEYPLLGRWAGRLAAALAAAWLLVLIGGIFASAGAIFGMSEAGIRDGSEKLANHISRKHADWFNNAATEQEKATINQFSGGTVYITGPDVWIDGAWWSKQDRAALITELGGIRSAIDWQISSAYFWAALTAMILGAVWSVFLLNLKRYRLIIFALLPVGLACTFAIMANSAPSRMSMAWGGRGAVRSIHEATAILWPWLVAISLGASFVSFCIGLMIGRPLIRRLARLLLPPRMLGSLAFLWIADGKKPPRTAPAR